MATTDDLKSKINDRYGKMSKGQKLLSNYILENYDKAAFLTAASMGTIVGVSESTVVRFASFLGYSGYPEFQRAMESMVQDKLNTAGTAEVTNGEIKRNGVLASVLAADAEKIKSTMDTIDEAAFDMAVDTLLEAKRIYVVGIRTCAPLASFLSFYLNLLFDNVINLQTSSASELFEQMIRIDEDDCIVGISFPRYSIRTLKAMEFANSRRAKVITITDSIHSPMNMYSSCNLIAQSDMISVVDSLVAPLSVINALIVALCKKKQSDIANTMDLLDSIWEEYQVYENDEIDLVDDSIRMQYPGEFDV